MSSWEYPCLVQRNLTGKAKICESSPYAVMRSERVQEATKVQLLRSKATALMNTYVGCCFDPDDNRQLECTTRFCLAPQR